MVPPTRPTILLFGDSITQRAFGEGGGIGWASLLAAAYSRRADVLNRGYSGYNTAHALQVLPAPSNHLFATVLLGSNDSAVVGDRQHIPLNEYRQNLKDIVSKILVRGDFPVLLMTPPPVDGLAWKAFLNTPELTRTNENSKAYGDAVKEVASELRCPVVDLWTLMNGAEKSRSLFLCDGLHLNEKGNRQVYNGIMDVLQSQFPDITPMTDGDGKYGSRGIPLEEKLWTELC